MTNYKATPKQWEVQEKFALESEEDACCLLELRSRIERLELGAGIHDIVSKELKNSLLPDPKRSLIQRVHSCIVGEPECGHMQARAVIFEMVLWLQSAGFHEAADALALEVDRD
jgi:hypothetical protein